MPRGASVSPEGAGSSKINRGPWFVLLAAVLWGTAGTAQALAPAGAQPVVVGALRLAVSGTTLLILVGARGGLGPLRQWPLLATVASSLWMAAIQVCFFAALSRTGVATGTTLFIGSAPIFAGLIAYIVNGERPDRKWAVATILAIVGCTLLVSGGEQLGVDPLGCVLAMAAGGFYSLYAVSIKTLLRERSVVSVLAVTLSLGAVLLSPFILSAELTWLSSPSGVLLALYLGLLTSAAPYCLFAHGLRLIPVSSAVTLNLAEPLTAAFLGVLLLGEQLSLSALMGMGLLVGGLLLMSVSPRVFLTTIRRKVGCSPEGV